MNQTKALGVWWLWLIVVTPVAIGSFLSVIISILRPTMVAVVTISIVGALAAIGLGISAILALLYVRYLRGLSRRTTKMNLERTHAEDLDRQVHAERMRLLLRLDHELKNPLQALKLAVAGADADPRQALSTVEDQASRITSLLSDLRKLAELERCPLDLAPVDLAELLNEVRDEVALRAGGAERHWTVNLPRAPWPVPTLMADPDLVFLAVHNLAENALKYSRPGDAIELRVSEPQEGWVLVEVADTGTGIPANETERVWEELARASTTRAIPGTGMGLPLVRTVARRHGGNATLRSRIGHGTAVSLLLPVRPPAAPAHTG